jgi:Lanthionine synthetase C-like protein
VADGPPDGAVLASGALEWLLAVAREDGTALAWTGRPDDDELNPTLYGGTAGIVLALLEGYRHFGDDRFAVAAARSATSIAAATDREWELSSQYFGLAGMAFALRAAAGISASAPRTSRRTVPWTWSARVLTECGGPTSSSCWGVTPE